MLNSMKAAVALALLGAGSLAAAPVHAQAQYPNQSVKFVVPFSPGGLPIPWRASSARNCRSGSVSRW